LAIGGAGSYNAGLLAAQILALHDPELAKRLQARRDTTRAEILQSELP
jgi:5-(carboxyamino)imidazole ribonucleotide mutase